MPAPITRTVDQQDDYFGTVVPDPYRWLEGSAEDSEIAAWVAAQAGHTRAYLDALPGRDQVSALVTELASLPVSGAPRRRGERWFRFTTDGTSEQQVYRVADTPLGSGTVVLDPQRSGPDEDTAPPGRSLAGAVPSPDGRLVAFSYSEAGSDWQRWRVREVDSGHDLPDIVEWAKFTEPAWLPDSSGFVYGGFAPPPVGADPLTSAVSGHQLRLHRLGTAGEDAVVFELGDEPEVIFEPEVSEDDRWLVILGERGTDPGNRVWIRPLLDDGGVTRLGPAQALIASAERSWRPVGTVAGTLVMLTDAEAPSGRLVSLDPLSGAQAELVAEGRDTLQDAVCAAGMLVVHWLSDARSRLTVHDGAGVLQRELELPDMGSVLELRAADEDRLVHLSTTSFTDPRSVLAVTLDDGAIQVLFRSSHPALAGVDTEQRWFTSADGTSVPMFVVRRSAAPTPSSTGPAEPSPTMLYGYGGFRIPVTPAFSVARAAFVALGGVLAVPSLRGGGEYGSRWHDAGRGANKQNVFDDGIAAAEYLIAEGISSNATLAATGGSNGGLLAGALLTQRPDLFAAVVPEVGVLDLLRFGLFTIGWAWTSDYGDPHRSRQEFQTAYAYSPLHRVRPGVTYPPTMVMTSDHDDRVVPAHSYKFAATLQAATGEDATVLLRVETGGGHGAGRARSAIIAERTDFLSFLCHHTGLVPTAATLNRPVPPTRAGTPG